MQALVRSPSLRYFALPFAVMVVAWGWALGFKGPAFLAAVAVLTAVEITFSFDNATIDAKLLGEMSPGWQQVFLTIGPVIGVGVVRLILPIMIVAITAALGFGEVWHEAWHNQALYQVNLEAARPAIVALAAPYLALTFLTWAGHPDKRVHWPVMAWAERWLQRASAGGPYLAAGAVLAAMWLIQWVSGGQWFVFGVVSVAVFLAVHLLNERTTAYLARGGGRHAARNVTFAAGLAALVRLEVVDASFSLDSVSGAFAITSDFAIILVGLGVGAFFVRAFTKLAVDHGTLDKLIYLEHGAHWSIGALAVMLPLSMVVEIPQYLIGAISVGVILAAVASSVAHNRRAAAGAMA